MHSCYYTNCIGDEIEGSVTVDVDDDIEKIAAYTHMTADELRREIQKIVDADRANEEER